MRWKSNYNSYDWHRRFAWFPVRTIDGTWVWLETVERVYFLSPLVSAAQYRRTSGLSYAYRTIQS